MANHGFRFQTSGISLANHFGRQNQRIGYSHDRTLTKAVGVAAAPVRRRLPALKNKEARVA